MNQDRSTYFAARAEEEIAAAQAASSTEAVRAHYQLAGLYLDLAYQNELEIEAAAA